MEGRFSVWLVGTSSTPLNPFGWFCFWFWVVSEYELRPLSSYADWHSAEHWGGPLWRPVLWTAAALVSSDSQLHLLHAKSTPGSAGSPACALVQKLSQAAIWGNHRVNLVSQRSLFLATWVQCLLYIFVHPWPVSGQTAHLGPAAPSSPIEEVSISNTCNLFPPSLTVRCI